MPPYADPSQRRAMQGGAASPERVTQGFVANLTWAWRHPSLSLLEIGWRWLYGAPALWLVWHVLQRALASVPWQSTGVQRISANQLLTDPMGAAFSMSQFVAMVMPHLLAPARWLVPLLIVGWIALSAFGRTLVLRRMDHELRPRTGTVLLLQALRVLVSALVAVAWWKGLEGLGWLTITRHVLNGGDPRILQYTGGAIVLTLGLFVLTGAISWMFAAAPILAMRNGSGVVGSLRDAALAHGARGGMMEINLVLSVVKIMLIVLAMAFSAFPLPFTNVMTDEYVLIWSALVGLWYFAASDFFHVTRLHAFVGLLRRRELTHAAVAASE